jgi:hypothetical protein
LAKCEALDMVLAKLKSFIMVLIEFEFAPRVMPRTTFLQSNKPWPTLDKL